MIADRARDGLAEVVVTVHLGQRERVCSNREAVEEKPFHSGLRREALDNALAAGLDSLVGQGNADSALRFANVVV